jgi:hypothetical protein
MPFCLRAAEQRLSIVPGASPGYAAHAHLSPGGRFSPLSSHPVLPHVGAHLLHATPNRPHPHVIKEAALVFAFPFPIRLHGWRRRQTR